MGDMKLGVMWADLVRSLFRRPATEKYPFERRPTPKRLRGALRWNPEKCTGCALCVKDCPADAIELITLDKANKRFVMRYHADRCTFCAQCVQNCRFKCLEMSNEEWELAALNREPFEVYYGEEADVAAFLAQRARPDPEPAG
jgi:NAD(P)H-quinone oxidoreductase subunit I